MGLYAVKLEPAFLPAAPLSFVDTLNLQKPCALRLTSMAIAPTSPTILADRDTRSPTQPR